jgi:hypothetical protein
MKGNVTLSLATKVSGVVGNATLLNLTITPGNNTFPMAATLDQAKALASTDANGFMDVSITGTSVIYNGQHITYYVSLPLYFQSRRNQYSDRRYCICRRKHWRATSSV